MNLLALRTEVKDHGFGTGEYNATRVNSFLNDALALICRRVDYYTDETVYDFNTVSGTASYPIPQNFAKLRSLRFTAVQGYQSPELEAVALRDIDRSPQTTGQPFYYAMDATNLHLYPTPNGVFALELRYWQMPTPLAGDTDIPSLPVDAHKMLWQYAVAECYAADDDPTTAQYWSGRFAASLADFAASAKFPNDDSPSVVKGMWTEDRVLSWSYPRS